jgi:hypothetical protein
VDVAPRETKADPSRVAEARRKTKRRSLWVSADFVVVAPHLRSKYALSRAAEIKVELGRRTRKERASPSRRRRKAKRFRYRDQLTSRNPEPEASQDGVEGYCIYL